MNYLSYVAHIVYASEDKFAGILGVSLVSLYGERKNFISGNGYNREISSISYCMLYCSEAIAYIRLTCRGDGYLDQVGFWLDDRIIPTERIVDGVVTADKLAKGIVENEILAANAVSSYLFRKLSRVLYLGCDIIIRRSIREFNSVIIFYDFTYKEMLIYCKPPVFYSEVKVRNTVDNPTIILFILQLVS